MIRSGADATEWPIVFQTSDILIEFRTNDMRNPFTKSVRSRSNAGKRFTNSLATLLAISFRKTPTRKQTRPPIPTHREGMSLYDSGGRKYLNIAERRRFIQAADRAEIKIRLFCLVLAWSGCRISEALATVPSSLDFDSGVIEFETLKRRQRGFVRQVPLPADLLHELNSVFKLDAAQRDPTRVRMRLWNWSRTTAWRHVKKVTRNADLHGSSATPKGLRHTFGVAAFNAVPPHMVQRWLGHASLRTTAIYGDVSGPEERSFAERLWRDW